MIKKIVSFSVYHPVSVLMLHLALLLCCCIGLYTVQLDFMPKMNERFLLISADFTGVSAQDMRKLVTIPVEDAAASLKGIKNISSVTRDGLSLVVVELHWNVDADIAIVECRQIIDQCYEALPNGCAKPNVAFFNPVHRETLTLVVFPNDNDLEYGRHIVDTDIRPHLQRVKGVGSVSVTGGEKPEVKVVLDKAKLESIPVSLQSVAEILSQANFEYPSGSVSDGGKELLFRTSGLFTTLGDIEDVPFLYGSGGVLKIKDVGTVSLGTEKKESFFMYNGREAICVKIYKKADASPLAVSKKLTREIDRLHNSYGGNFTFKIVFDLSDELTASIRNLCVSAALGAVITAIVLFLFLRTLRISLLAASVMPLSILFSVFVLALCGKTVNILSVSGITIGIGMVIDPAAVAIENVLEKLKRQPDPSAAKSIVDGAAETSLSSSGSAVTTIAAFVPFFFFPGLFGKLFSDMALAVIASIAFSFVLAMTYIPAAMSLQSKKLIDNIAASSKRSFKRQRGLERSARIESCVRVPAISCSEKLYGDCLKTIFEKKYAIPVLLAACLCVGTLCVLLLKKELLPVSPSGTVGATIRYGTAPSLDALFSDADFINRALSAEDFIDTVYISGGIEKDDYEQLAAPEAKKETMRITCSGKSPEKIAAALDAILQNTNMRYTLETSRNLLEEMLASDTTPLIVTASSPEAAAETALTFCDERGIAPYDILQEAAFIPDRSACARFAVPASHTAAAAYAALEGVESNAFYTGGRKIPLRVSFADGTFTAIEQLMRTGVVAGKTDIPLSSLGTVEAVENEKTLFRWNRKDAKKISGVPKEKSVNFDGIVSLRDMQMKEFFKSAAVLLAVVFLLLYCIMGAQFESFIIPLLMFVSIPPAFAGAFALLLLCNRSLNIHSVIALVVLFGTTVNNAIILYESIIRQKDITEQSVIAASVAKLRPILITTLTTVFAVVPFAVDPLRKNQQSSMAIAIVGGLIASFVVVLALMPPLLFSVLKRRRLP